MGLVEIELSFTVEELAQIDAAAREANLGREEFIVNCLEKYVEKLEKEDTKKE